MLQDSTFVCNSRQVYDAYRGNVYMMQYNFPPATHGSDLIASSWYKGVAIGDLITSYIPKLPKGVAVLIDNLIAPLSGPYQRYFASHAVTGSPNNLKQRGAIDWPTSEDNGNTIVNVLKAGIALDSDPNTGLFVVNEDKESSAENCAFWNDVADEIQSISSMESKHQTTKFGKKKGQSSLLVQTT